MPSTAIVSMGLFDTPKRGKAKKRESSSNTKSLIEGQDLEPMDLEEGDLIRGPEGTQREIKTTSVINVFDKKGNEISLDELNEFERVERSLNPVAFQRAAPSGKFTPANVSEDPEVPADRGPDGEFVSPNREPIDEFGRKENGIFDQF